MIRGTSVVSAGGTYEDTLALDSCSTNIIRCKRRIVKVCISGLMSMYDFLWKYVTVIKTRNFELHFSVNANRHWKNTNKKVLARGYTIPILNRLFLWSFMIYGKSKVICRIIFSGCSAESTTVSSTKKIRLISCCSTYLLNRI